MLRYVINALFPSILVFPDGSRVDYLIRDDCLRFTSAAPIRRMVEVPLIYDVASKRSRIDTSVNWRWKADKTLLTEQERSELILKLKEFMAKRPKEFAVELS